MKDCLVPHDEIIIENGTISIPSIFMFNGGADELFPFLHKCREKKCTVRFLNEDITVKPDGDSYQNVILSIYVTIAAEPKMAHQYIRYLLNLDKMSWDEVKSCI